MQIARMVVIGLGRMFKLLYSGWSLVTSGNSFYFINFDIFSRFWLKKEDPSKFLQNYIVINK